MALMCIYNRFGYWLLPLVSRDTSQYVSKIISTIMPLCPHAVMEDRFWCGAVTCNQSLMGSIGKPSLLSITHVAISLISGNQQPFNYMHGIFSALHFVECIIISSWTVCRRLLAVSHGVIQNQGFDFIPSPILTRF